jgi:cobalt transporter subunit CbtB
MNASISSSSAVTTVAPATFTLSVLAQLGAALALGLVMLYAVGFSEASVAHNAAHDVRHANGRPCH